MLLYQDVNEQYLKQKKQTRFEYFVLKSFFFKKTMDLFVGNAQKTCMKSHFYNILRGDTIIFLPSHSVINIVQQNVPDLTVNVNMSAAALELSSAFT